MDKRLSLTPELSLSPHELVSLIRINSINQEPLLSTNGVLLQLMIIHEAGLGAPAHWWRLTGGRCPPDLPRGVVRNRGVCLA